MKVSEFMFLFLMASLAASGIIISLRLAITANALETIAKGCT